MPEIDLVCNVCRKNKAIGVASVPGVPISVAYCMDCLEAGAHPIGIMIANTACLGGLDRAAGYWKYMVYDSLYRIGKDLEWFNTEVEKAIKEFPE